MNRTRTHKKVISCRLKHSLLLITPHIPKHLSKAATCNISVIFLNFEIRRAVEVIMECPKVKTNIVGKNCFPSCSGCRSTVCYFLGSMHGEATI